MSRLIVSPIARAVFTLMTRLELGWSFDGQLRRLCPFEYLVHIRGGAPEQIVKVRSVGHETSGVHELPCLIHPRQSAVCRELHDALVLAEQHRTRHYDESVRALFHHRGESACDLVRTVGWHELQLHSQGPRRVLNTLHDVRHRVFALRMGRPGCSLANESGNDISEQLEALGEEFRAEKALPSNITARPR